MNETVREFGNCWVMLRFGSQVAETFSDAT